MSERPQPDQEVASTTSFELCVLAIDDTVEDLDLMGRHLERAPGLDAELLTAVSVEDAQRVLAGEKVDVVLCDYHLGAFKGPEVIARIRRSGFRGPVLMLTGRGGENVAAASFRAGAIDYLRKAQVSPAALGRTLRHAVEKHRLSQALEERNEELATTIEALTRQQKEMRQFHHVLSHELKTPLTATSEFIALVLDGLAGETTPEQRDYLAVAQRNCAAIQRNIDDILDASRIETGRLSVRREVCELDQLLERVVACLESRARAAGLVLALRRPERSTAALVNVDEHRIFQILTNLVSNAIKFTPREGEVAVELEVDETEQLLHVSVRDSGRGISPQELPLVFERGFQVQPEDATVKGGLGIGLYLCRQLARLHGGDIEASSEPETGSCFVLELPVHQAEPAEGTGGSRTASSQGPGGGLQHTLGS